MVVVVVAFFVYLKACCCTVGLLLSGLFDSCWSRVSQNRVDHCLGDILVQSTDNWLRHLSPNLSDKQKRYLHSNGSAWFTALCFDLLFLNFHLGFSSTGFGRWSAKLPTGSFPSNERYLFKSSFFLIFDFNPFCFLCCCFDSVLFCQNDFEFLFSMDFFLDGFNSHSIDTLMDWIDCASIPPPKGVGNVGTFRWWIFMAASSPDSIVSLATPWSSPSNRHLVWNHRMEPELSTHFLFSRPSLWLVHLSGLNCCYPLLFSKKTKQKKELHSILFIFVLLFLGWPFGGPPL